MDAMEIELLLNPELVQLLPNWDELNAQWVSKKYFTVGGPFLRIEKGKINANYERLKGKSQKDE